MVVLGIMEEDFYEDFLIVFGSIGIWIVIILFVLLEVFKKMVFDNK